MLRNYKSILSAYHTGMSQQVTMPHQRHMGVVTIHKADPTKMNHQECEQNPILGKKGFQHYTMGYTTCNSPDCPNKKCLNICQQPSETEAIGHGTHDPKYPSRKLSSTDMNGNPNRPQYGRFYKYDERPKISEPKETLDQTKTQQVNSDKEMVDNIHLYKKFTE